MMVDTTFQTTDMKNTVHDWTTGAPPHCIMVRLTHNINNVSGKDVMNNSILLTLSGGQLLQSSLLAFAPTCQHTANFYRAFPKDKQNVGDHSTFCPKNSILHNIIFVPGVYMGPYTRCVGMIIHYRRTTKLECRVYNLHTSYMLTWLDTLVCICTQAGNSKGMYFAKIPGVGFMPLGPPIYPVANPC